MRGAVWACIVILSCAASPANAAGIQLFNGPALSGAIWYPCPQAKPVDVPLGELAMAADFGLVGVKDCPVTGEKLPLIVPSE